jgi:NIMA (never in mitosis gene a)-related kinase
MMNVMNVMNVKTDYYAYGAYGKVYINSTCPEECIKVQDMFLKYDDPKDDYSLQDAGLREYLFYKHIQHPNIPKCLDLQITPDDYKLNIKMPLAKMGSLDKYKKSITTYERYKKFSVIFRQLAMALRFLHNNNIIHGDIKSTNILVNSLNDNDIWLIDFGSAVINLKQPTHTTYWFLSPEECLDNRISISNDIWSLGICMYNFLSSEPMYTPNTKQEIVKSYKNKKITQEFIYSQIDKNINHSRLKGIIKSCLRIDPSSRVNALDLYYLLEKYKHINIDNIGKCTLSSDFITQYMKNSKKNILSESEIDILQNLQHIYLNPTDSNDPFVEILDDNMKRKIIKIIEQL